MAGSAVRRTESRAGEVFPRPLAPPCAVTPVPPVVAASGATPDYSAPRLDENRPGTYWSNLERPTASAGRDLEGVAFHEAVAGHHLQLSRVQLLGYLSAFQHRRSYTVFAEGRGLYAEQLAEEIDRYIFWPGQAVGYLTGTLRMRVVALGDQARRSLGATWGLPGSHADEIDRGSLRVLVLACIGRWTAGH